MFNIYRRKVVNENRCFRCGNYETGCDSVIDFAENILKRVSRTKQHIWVTILYNLWNAKNALLFEGVEPNYNSIVEDAEIMCAEHCKAQEGKLINAPDSNISNAGPQQDWKKPPPGFVKLNSDAAVSEEDECGVGIIARDEWGSGIFTGAKRVQASSCVRIVEAEAIIYALHEGRDQGLPRVIISIDCLLAIHQIRSAKKPKGEMGNLLKCIDNLSSGFEECRFVHERRQANRAAHLLASYRPIVPILWTIFFSFPCELVDVIELDVT